MNKKLIVQQLGKLYNERLITFAARNSVCITLQQWDLTWNAQKESYNPVDNYAFTNGGSFVEEIAVFLFMSNVFQTNACYLISFGLQIQNKDFWVRW